MSQYISDLDKERNLYLKNTEMLLQTVQKNSYKIIITFKLMIKKTFVKNCHNSNSLINNFKSTDFVLLDHHILLKNTVTEKDLIRLNKSTDKKRNNLSADNFHCSFSNKHMKNTQKCTYVLERADSDLIF